MELAAGACIYVSSGTTIQAGAVLTVDAGVTIAFGNYDGLTVNGTLVTLGTAAGPVVFTAAGRAQAGAWGGIAFNSSSAGSSLTGAVVQYGGWKSGRGARQRGGYYDLWCDDPLQRERWRGRVSGAAQRDQQHTGE